MGGNSSTYTPTHHIMGGDPCTYAPVVVNGKNTWPGCERKNIGGDPHTWSPTGMPPLEPGPVIIDSIAPLKFLA